MGLITHEVPFLMTNHPVAYEGVDSAHPLEPGMVLSVETTMLHPTRGFIKIEDTITITDDRARTARRSRPRLEPGREVGLPCVRPWLRKAVPQLFGAMALHTPHQPMMAPMRMATPSQWPALMKVRSQPKPW